ncbi:MAG TPA: choice-of-anchor D domain-containing protein, partial [Pirellulales bacterium]
FTKWIAFGNRATDAPYTVFDGATPLGTVNVNQTIPPSGDQSNAIVWQSLGSFSVSSGTLAVRLSDNANGFVIADAVRIVAGGIAPQMPEMNVSSFDQSIPTGDETPTFVDGTDFGSIPAVTNSVTHTFTITNNGNATLHLNGVSVVPEPSPNPDPFNVVTQPASSVDPGASTTFTVMFHPTALGVQSAVFSIANDDDSEHPYTFAVQGTGLDPGPAELTIDDSQPGFQAIGNWVTSTNTLAVGSEVRSSVAGQGSNTATWTFPNLAPGLYQVYTSWIPFGNRASNAPFVISDGPTVRSTVLVDQRQMPNDQFFDGVGYRSLASVFSSNATITVTLNNQANGFVIADAVRLVRMDLPALPLAPAPAVVASALDVNADGRISSVDALLVIQALLNPQGVVATSLASTGSAPAGLGGRLDVNGDGRISVRDALEVISYLVKPHIPAATQLSAPASEPAPPATALAAVDQAHSEGDGAIQANTLLDSDLDQLASDAGTHGSTCTMQVAPAQRTVPTTKKPTCSTTEPEAV